MSVFIAIYNTIYQSTVVVYFQRGNSKTSGYNVLTYTRFPGGINKIMHHRVTVERLDFKLCLNIRSIITKWFVVYKYHRIYDGVMQWSALHMTVPSWGSSECRLSVDLPLKIPVMPSFDVSFVFILNNLSKTGKLSVAWVVMTLMWHHCNRLVPKEY